MLFLSQNVVNSKTGLLTCSAWESSYITPCAGKEPGNQDMCSRSFGLALSKKSYYLSELHNLLGECRDWNLIKRIFDSEVVLKKKKKKEKYRLGKKKESSFPMYQNSLFQYSCGLRQCMRVPRHSCDSTVIHTTVNWSPRLEPQRLSFTSDKALAVLVCAGSS